MRLGILTVLALCAALATGAFAADNCTKECALSYQACAKNHSQGACKNERDICLKHCAKK